LSKAAISGFLHHRESCFAEQILPREMPPDYFLFMEGADWRADLIRGECLAEFIAAGLPAYVHAQSFLPLIRVERGL